MEGEHKRGGGLNAGASHKPHRPTPAPGVCIVAALFGAMLAESHAAVPRLRGMWIEPAAIAMLDEIYQRYARWHVDTGKRIWSDLEIWEMDGKQGYRAAYPATFARVKRQIEIDSGNVEMLTGYAWHRYMQSSSASAEKPNPQARALFEAYRKFVATAAPSAAH